MLKFSIQPIFLNFQLILKFSDDVGYFLLDLIFNSVDVLLYGREMLLFLFLPFQKAFDSFDTYHLFVNAIH